MPLWLSGMLGPAIMRAPSAMPLLRSRLHAPAALLIAGGLVAAGCKTDGIAAAKYAPPPAPREVGLHAYGPARYVADG
ncbi:MAG: hypothetical protein U0441_39230, partial [Polyangiaceae bacterium]